MENRKKYINKELSWLSFNKLILNEAENTDRPVYDRIKFLSIYSSNLDEFYRIKVGALKKLNQVDKKNIKTHLGFSPKKTIRLISEEVKEQYQSFDRIFQKDLLIDLARNGIHIWNGETLNKCKFK